MVARMLTAADVSPDTSADARSPVQSNLFLSWLEAAARGRGPGKRGRTFNRAPRCRDAVRCPMRLARRTGRRTRALPARRPLRTTRRGPRERPRAHAQPLQARFRPLRVPPPRQDGLHGGPPRPPPPCPETAGGFEMGGSRCGGSLRRPRTAGLRRRSQRAGSAWAEARRRQRDGQRPGRSGRGELQRRPRAECF